MEMQVSPLAARRTSSAPTTTPSHGTAQCPTGSRTCPLPALKSVPRAMSPGCRSSAGHTLGKGTPCQEGHATPGSELHGPAQVSHSLGSEVLLHSLASAIDAINASRVLRQQTSSFFQGKARCLQSRPTTLCSVRLPRLDQASHACTPHRSNAKQAPCSKPCDPLTSRARSSGISGSSGTPTASIVSWRSYRGMSGSMAMESWSSCRAQVQRLKYCPGLRSEPFRPRLQDETARRQSKEQSIL